MRSRTRGCMCSQWADPHTCATNLYRPHEQPRRMIYLRNFTTGGCRCFPSVTSSSFTFASLPEVIVATLRRRTCHNASVFDHDHISSIQKEQTHEVSDKLRTSFAHRSATTIFEHGLGITEGNQKGNKRRRRSRKNRKRWRMAGSISSSSPPVSGRFVWQKPRQASFMEREKKQHDGKKEQQGEVGTEKEGDAG